MEAVTVAPLVNPPPPFVTLKLASFWPMLTVSTVAVLSRDRWIVSAVVVPETKIGLLESVDIITSFPATGLSVNATAPELGVSVTTDELAETLPATSRTVAWIACASPSFQASAGDHSHSPAASARNDATIDVPS